MTDMRKIEDASVTDSGKKINREKSARTDSKMQSKSVSEPVLESEAKKSKVPNVKKAKAEQADKAAKKEAKKVKKEAEAKAKDLAKKEKEAKKKAESQAKKKAKLAKKAAEKSQKLAKEKLKKQGKDKSKIVYESRMQRLEAVNYFDALASGLKKGSVIFKQGNDIVAVSPSELVDVEIHARSKGRKERVTFELSWVSDKASDISISSK